MILTCPDCATRYFVPDDKLGPGGRTVRCAGCGSTWRASADAPLDLVADETGAAAAEPRSFAAEPAPLADAPAADLPKILRAKAEEKRRKGQLAVAGAVWGVLGCLFAGLFASAYAFRQDVVELVPRTAGAYAAVGVPVNPTGLEFSQVKASPALHDGSPAITVSGVVKNVSDRTRTAPPLVVALLDPKGRRVSAAVVAAVHGPVRPGAEARFATVLPDPDSKAADVDLRFARPGETPAPARIPQQAAASHAPPVLRPSLEAAADVASHAPAEPALDEHGAGAVSAAPHG